MDDRCTIVKLKPQKNRRMWIIHVETLFDFVLIIFLTRASQLLSCAINGACMAMLNTGFPMKYLVASVTCAILSDGTMKTDPTLKQEKVIVNKERNLMNFQNFRYDLISIFLRDTINSIQYYHV